MLITTNEWTEIKPGIKPWKGREVLCRMSDGSKRTLVWNAIYWTDPKTHIRQIFHESGIHPTHFYIFEKFNDKDI